MCTKSDPGCTTAAESNIKAVGEDNEDVKAVCVDVIKADGGGDINADGNVWLVLVFNRGVETAGTADAKFTDCW